MINAIIDILINSLNLLNEMAPYLIVGFLFAGILNEYLSAEWIATHLGKNNIGSVIKSALFGIPLPLCSCGVLPPTLALRKGGASRGSVLSFLIATPTSGVDSILATYSLMGPVFTIFRVVASFVTGLLSGFMATLFDKSPDVRPEGKVVAKKESIPFFKRIGRIFHYAAIELMGDIGKWLFIGMLIGGVITFAIPDTFFTQQFTAGWQAILIMLVVSIPLYVCATGTIPIAAALMLKGLNPGAAFVLLLAGPATNAVSLTVISKELGKRTTIIYLATLIVSSVSMGLLLDFIWKHFSLSYNFQMTHHHDMGQSVWQILASAVIVLSYITALISRNKNKWLKKKTTIGENAVQTQLKVNDMTCHNCVRHVSNALNDIEGVGNVDVDLDSKIVTVSLESVIENEKLFQAVKDAGYTPENA